MSITLHTTAYGAPATQLLRSRVGAVKADSPLAPVTIVVPTNFVGVSIRRELAGDRSGIIGLSILTTYRLAELLGAPALAAQGRRPVSAPVIGAAVRQVLAHHPGMFEAVREHPSTEAALVRTHRELSECTPAVLDALAATSGRSAEVVRIHRGVVACLEGDWYDEAALMASAATVAQTSTVLDDLGTIVLHLPQRCSPAAATLLRALADRAPLEVIVGLTGQDAADESAVQVMERLGLDRGLAQPPEAEAAAIRATRIVSVSDAEEEARTAVDAILRAARDDVPLERMAVLYPQAEPYARIIADRFDAAGIPWNGRAVRPVGQRLAGRWLLDLLGLDDRRWSRPAVIGLFASAPVRPKADTTMKVAAWERLSREAGIVDGREAWQVRLEALVDDLQESARREQARPDDERQDWLVERHLDDARMATDLSEAVEALATDLDDGRSRTTWSALAQWAGWMLGNHLGREQERARWPDVEQVAAQRVEAALQRLGALEQIEPTTDLHTFTNALELELADDLDRVGRFGEGVLVGTVAAGLGLDLDVVVVLGMAESVLPTRPREDSLLADADRAVVADQLAPRSHRVRREHRQFLASVSAARRQRVLVFPRGDLRRSVERAPSRWLLDAIEERTGDRRLDADVVEVVPSFAARISHADFPGDDQEFRLAAVHDAVPGMRLDARAAAAIDAVLADGAALIDGRGRDRFTPYNGDLSQVAHLMEAVHGPDRLLSASRVQMYFGCPHAYLGNYVLGVKPIENPEEQWAISALDRGSLIHDVLEDWLGSQLQAGTVPSRDQAWSDQARDDLRRIADQHLDRIATSGIVGHPMLWQRDRAQIREDLLTFPDKDDLRRRDRGLTPVMVEAPFGYDDVPPLRVDLGDGRSMSFRGRIDRLDRFADGGLLVTDYKTGRFDSYRNLSADEPDSHGSNLQLLLYALAARHITGDADVPVVAEYWFPTDKGKWQSAGYPVGPEQVDRLLHVLRTAADQIAAGVFPQRPEAPRWSPWVSCHYCDPDELGTAQRHRAWERLAHAPQLRDYLAIVEPDFVSSLEADIDGGGQ